MSTSTTTLGGRCSSGFRATAVAPFYERSGGLSIVDTRDLSSLPLDIDGRIEAIEADEEGAVILVLSSSGKTHTLSVVEPPNHRLATARFQADDAFMALRGASIYLGATGRFPPRHQGLR
jgi:hypothetical protein